MMIFMIPGFTLDLIFMANQCYEDLVREDNPMKPPFPVDKKSFIVGCIIGYLQRMSNEE